MPNVVTHVRNTRPYQYLCSLTCATWSTCCARSEVARTETSGRTRYGTCIIRANILSLFLHSHYLWEPAFIYKYFPFCMTSTVRIETFSPEPMRQIASRAPLISALLSVFIARNKASLTHWPTTHCIPSSYTLAFQSEACTTPLRCRLSSGIHNFCWRRQDSLTIGMARLPSAPPK